MHSFENTDSFENSFENSMSQDAFSTALNLFPFPRKIIASFSCSPLGRKQTFKVQKRYLLCLIVRSTLSYFDFLLTSICLYVLVVSLAKGRGDRPTLKRCRDRYLPLFLSQSVSPALVQMALSRTVESHFSMSLW